MRNGIVSVKESATLYRDNESPIEGIREVSAAIEQLLHINLNQFKQIAMIAQGEFWDLLNAKTDERTAILRTIFMTDGYKNIEYKLKDRMDGAFGEFKDAEKSIIQFFHGAKADENSEQYEALEELKTRADCSASAWNITEMLTYLAALDAEDKMLEKEVNKELKDAECAQKALQKELNLAKTNNGFVDRLRNLEAKKAELDKKRTEIAEKEKELEKQLLAVNKVKPAYDNWKNHAEAIDAAKEVKIEMEKAFSESKDALRAAQEQFEESKKREKDKGELAVKAEQITKDEKKYSERESIISKIEDYYKKKLLELLSKCLPLSIIEQKEYNQNNQISDELKLKHIRLINLKREYAELCEKNDVDSDAVQNISEEIQAISNQLEIVHPSYRPLDVFVGTDWDAIKTGLKDDEIVYQFVLTQLNVVSVIVTNKETDIRCNMLDPHYDLPYQVMEKYINVMEKAHVGDKDVSDYSKKISILVAEHLCEYVWSHDVKKIYVIPDVSKSRFPISAVEYKEEFLIDKVDSIINCIGYRQLCSLLNETSKSEIKVFNKVFGKKEDSSINKLVNHFSTEKFPSISSDVSCLDSFDSIKKANDDGINTLAIYGHGVGNLGNFGIDGAQCIQGAKRMIHIKDILDDSDFMNLILISCLGGSPNSDNPETSSGTWADIFEKVQGNILSCIWSVPTSETIELMDCVYDNLVNKKMDFGSALLHAQKKLKNNGKNQFCWAGVEYWIN